MDQKLRPVIGSATLLSSVFFIMGYFVRADVPVPGTVYLLVPSIALLTFYMSFEPMGRYVSPCVIGEGFRVSRQIEPIPPAMRDGEDEWLFIAESGWKFSRYILNADNVDGGIGSLTIAPPYLVEIYNGMVVRIFGRRHRLSPFAVHVLMQRRKWRNAFLRYDGFDPEITKVYMVVYSTSIHPDAWHYHDIPGGLASLSAELSRTEVEFERVHSGLQKRLGDQISLFQTLTRNPDEVAAIKRTPPPQEAEPR